MAADEEPFLTQNRRTGGTYGTDGRVQRETIIAVTARNEQSRRGHQLAIAPTRTLSHIAASAQTITKAYYDADIMRVRMR